MMAMLAPGDHTMAAFAPTYSAIGKRSIATCGSRRLPGQVGTSRLSARYISQTSLGCALALRRLRSKGGIRQGEKVSSAALDSTAAFATARSPGLPQAHIITACNEFRQETVVLERSARFGGYAFHSTGLGLQYQGPNHKLWMYDQALERLVGRVINPDDAVMLVDAWDTVVLGPATELQEKVRRLSSSLGSSAVICGGDRICCPDYSMALPMERLFSDIQLPWRYPNSGGIAGTAAALRDFMHCLVHSKDGGKFQIDGDDQTRIQEFLLARAAQGRAYPFAIDSECSIFQCMGEPECGWDAMPSDAQRDDGITPAGPAPRIRNLTTGQWPILAHGCGGHGRWFLADVYRDLELLDYLQIRPGDLAGLKFAGLVPPGQKVSEEHWVNQAPWDFPFQLFFAMRSSALRKEQGIKD